MKEKHNENNLEEMIISRLDAEEPLQAFKIMISALRQESHTLEMLAYHLERMIDNG